MTPKRLIAGIGVGRNAPTGTRAGGVAEAARAAIAAGAEEIALLDEAFSLGEIGELVRATSEVARAVGPAPVSAGGGVASLEDVGRLLNAGASRVLLSTMAVVNPELVRQAAERFGSQAVSALIEVRLERRRGEAAVDVSSDGAMRLTGEEAAGWYRVYVRGGNTATSRNAIAWAQECVQLGAGEVVVRAIESAGEAARYDLELVGRMSEAVDVPVLVAGPSEPIETMKNALTLSGARGLLMLEATPEPLTRLRSELERSGIVFARSAAPHA